MTRKQHLNLYLFIYTCTYTHVNILIVIDLEDISICLYNTVYLHLVKKQKLMDCLERKKFTSLSQIVADIQQLEG